MPGWAWVTAMVAAVPLLMYWPTHWALGKLFARSSGGGGDEPEGGGAGAAG
jgi:hypothetical protein